MKYKNFTLKEFIESETAQKKGIDNTPTFEVVEHLDNLVATILQPLRSAYGKAITVSSGYRCPALNKAVNGANGSAHLRGDAADLQVADMADFKAFLKKWLTAAKVKFDQCIIERSGKIEWIHISMYSANGSQRGQVFHMTV